MHGLDDSLNRIHQGAIPIKDQHTKPIHITLLIEKKAMTSLTCHLTNKNLITLVETVQLTSIEN